MKLILATLTVVLTSALAQGASEAATHLERKPLFCPHAYAAPFQTHGAQGLSVSLPTQCPPRPGTR